MRRRIILGLAALLALAHFAWLCSWVVIGYSGPDADGYFAQAQMLAVEGRTTFVPETPAQFIGMHWLEKPDGEYVSRYPVGLSSLLAVVWRTFGRDAMFFLNPLLASLTVWAVFLLGRRWIGDAPALAMALVQACYVTANYQALHSDSHTAAAFFLVAGVVALDRWDAKGQAALAALAGFLLGVVPAIRYAEGAAVVGVVAFLYFQLKRPDRRRQIPWAIAGAAVPVGLTMARNHTLFGAFWKTAYDLTGESSLSFEYFWRNWPDYLDTLSTSGVGLFFAMGLAGMGLMIARRESRALGAALLGASGAVTLVYCCYYSLADGPGGVRFVLPTLPLYLIPAVFFMKQAASGRTFAVLLVAFTALQAGRGAIGTQARLTDERVLASRSAIALKWLETNVPSGSVILADPRLHEQIHFAGLWKLADASLLGLGRGSGGAGPFGFGGFGGPPERGDGPSPRQRGKAETLRERYAAAPAHQRVQLVLDDVTQWAGGAQVYWVGTESQAASLPFAADEAGRIEMPAASGGPDSRPGPPQLGAPRFGPPGLRMGGPPGSGGRRGRRPGGPRFGLADETLIVYRLRL